MPPLRSECGSRKQPPLGLDVRGSLEGPALPQSELGFRHTLFGRCGRGFLLGCQERTQYELRQKEDSKRQRLAGFHWAPFAGARRDWARRTWKKRRRKG